MHIILPSAKIIEDELKQLTIFQRIDKCSSVCYQRPPKSTDQEAIAFCEKYAIERGHRAMLEFAIVHLIISRELARHLASEKFLMISTISDDKCCVTGSIRAWMEATSHVADYIRDHFLSYHYPSFFDSPHLELATRIRFAIPENGEIPPHHIYVAVRFVISRAMSHELVRHRPCSFLQESQRYVRYDGNVTFIRPLWACQNGSIMENLFMDECYDCEQAYKERRSRGMSPQMARGCLINDCKTEVIVYTNLQEWKHIFGLRCSKAADPEMQRVMKPLYQEFITKYLEFDWN